jgi:hypothetical protein
MMEVRGELFLSSKGDDLRFVGVGSKDVAILSKMSDLDKSQGIGTLTAKDDGNNEERSSQVAPEGHEPVEQHLVPGQFALECCNSGELHRLGIFTE